MAKFSAIVPVCIIALSGCALFDIPEVSNEPAPMSPPLVVEESPRAVVQTAQPEPEPRAAPAPERILTAEDVRRVQMGLREVGLDPGPIDGIAGTKTKIALTRLTAGCAKLDALGDRHALASRRGTVGADTVPGREAVIQMQTELRAAGFNPGPIDGVYGVRTKALVARLPAACAIAKEFSGALESAADHGNRQSAMRPAVETLDAARTQPGASRPDDSARAAAPVPTAQARDDIRILQLRLRDAGFDPGPFDGIMGAKTRAALAQYETSRRNGKLKTSLTASRISGQY